MPSTRQQRQANNRKNKAERARWREIKNIWPERDEDYKEWIRHLPCLVTLSRKLLVFEAEPLVAYALQRWSRDRQSECAHVGDSKGMGQKCSDRDTIPLSHWYHLEGPESHHKLTPGPRFFAHHILDRDALVAVLNRKYELCERMAL